jgi:hypothetical protein
MDAMTDPETSRHMRAITTGLQAALTAYLHDTNGVLDISATVRRPGNKDTHVIVDDDLYVEIRYWNRPWTPPERVAAAC